MTERLRILPIGILLVADGESSAGPMRPLPAPWLAADITGGADRACVIAPRSRGGMRSFPDVAERATTLRRSLLWISLS
jgi:hypothetical protein